MVKRLRITDEMLNTALAEFDFSQRILNMFEGMNLYTLQDLLYCCGRRNHCRQCEKEGICGVDIKLIDYPNFGKACLDEVFRILEENGMPRRAHEDEEK